MGESLQDLERYLLDARVLDISPPMSEGAHPPCRVLLEGGLTALAKFPSFARDGNGDELVRREAAAWLVAKTLGWGDLVPAAALRLIDSPKGEQERASIHVALLDAVDLPALDELQEVDVDRAAIFDIVINAGDREKNWMGVRSPSGFPVFLQLVDHGHAFGLRGWERVRSVFVRAREGKPIRPEFLDALRRFRDRAPLREFRELLGADLTRRMMDRVDRLIVDSTIRSD